MKKITNWNTISIIFDKIFFLKIKSDSFFNHTNKFKNAFKFLYNNLKKLQRTQ